MPKSSWVVVLAVAVVLPLVACAGESPAGKTGVSGPTRIPDAAVLASAPAGEAIATASVPRAVRRAVVADAAKRFKVAESAVVLAQAEKVTWSDGALGCAEPGTMYTQMLVDGFRVVAKTSAGSLAYNTDRAGRVVSCGSPGVKFANPPVMDNEPQPYSPSPPEK